MKIYFGTNTATWPSASSDTDGDGATLLQEFLAGTNPTNAASVLRVRMDTTAQGLFVKWNTEPGLMYQVQTRSNLTAPWVNLGGPRFAAGHLDSLFVGGGGASGYYLVIRLR
jgi:hypothetical protein